MDRISELPEFIVHHILSSFNFWDRTDGGKDRITQLVRMSVLSKKWFDITASFPILDFSIHIFTKGLHVSRESFFKYVEYTTSRFCHNNVTAQKFKLSANHLELTELDIVNRCLELVLKTGVKELVVDITNMSDVTDWYSAFVKPMHLYRLPKIGLSAFVLESLTIRGCELPSSLMIDVVKFKFLIRLELENVPIDDEAINYLNASCPLLQDFKVSRCHGLKRFCVYGHQNLQKVFISYNTQVERIDIEAPNLTDLIVVDEDERGGLRMNVASCKKLTTVTYYGHPLANSIGFIDFLSNFPFIENLCLVTKCNNLKLSSQSLRTLVLRSNCDLEEIEFRTPNLVVFNHSRNASLLWPQVMGTVWRLVRQSTHLKGCMQSYANSHIDTHWFKKLRLFLGKENGFKVLNLYISAVVSRKFIEFEKLRATGLPPYELEHVELRLEPHEESLHHVAFVDAVLWCCRPRSLTLRSSSPYIDYDFEKQSDVVKFTYEKLLEQEDQGHTNIQIVWPSSSGAQKQLRDLKSLPREGNAISFIKENVIQEEAG